MTRFLIPGLVFLALAGASWSFEAELSDPARRGERGGFHLDRDAALGSAAGNLRRSLAVNRVGRAADDSL